MKLLLVADVPGWAWDHKAHALKRHLKDEFEEIRIEYRKGFGKRKHLFSKYNHVHFFGWLEGRSFSPKYKGVTAGVSSFNYYYRHWGERSYMKTYGALTATSRLIYEDIKERNLAKKVYYCPNGVDEQLFQPRKKTKDLDKFVIGWSGQPTTGGFSRGGEIDMHGYQNLLIPLMESLKDHKDVKFSLSATTFKKAKPLSEMPPFYHNMDLFVHTGFGIGTPNPLFEAAACGIPAVSVAIGAAPEFITDSENGHLVKRYFNKEEARRRMEEIRCLILDLYDDRKRLRMMGVDARAEIEANWTWAERAKNWLPVFLNHGKAL